MRRPVVLVIAPFAIFALYLVALAHVIRFAAVQPTPRWWIAMFPTWRSASLTWLLCVHAAAVAFASLPFAWVVSRLYGRFAVYVSGVIAVVVWGVLEAPLAVEVTKNPRFFLKGMWLADTLQFLLILPALVWLLRKLPSNNRWRGP
jgi:hypothetical protein